MKYASYLVLAIIFILVSVSPASVHAIDTVPSQPAPTDGPFMITAYGFSGHSVRYVQVTNVSKELANLDGWVLRAVWGGASWEMGGLSGMVAPGKKVTIANVTMIPNATFSFQDTGTATEPFIDALTLVAPPGNSFNNHTVDTAVKSTTIRDTSTQPATFYGHRNTSSSTGSYLATFTMLASRPNVVESDPLYEPAQTSLLKIVEVYPNARKCAPIDGSVSCRDYVKLFNASSTAVDLSMFRLRTGTLASSSGVSLSGVVLSGGYVSVDITLSDLGNYAWLEDVYGQKVYRETIEQYPSASGHEGSVWAYNSAKDAWQWTDAFVAANAPIQFAAEAVENPCDTVRLSEIAANYSPQFIEIHNQSAAPASLSGCRLQTNRSAATYVLPNRVLAADEYLAVQVSATPLSLTKTTSGTVYLLSSDGQTEVDSRAYENLDASTSLALIGGVWQQTFSVTPSQPNVYEQYPPCQDGYVRDVSTGRCNKVVMATSLAACAADEYRNPETNRCRKVTAASTSLTPCGEGQERNPATNRCRSIASAVAELLPCDEGYERNPATNRCRKISSAISSSTTPVSAIEQAEGKGWTSWTWALVAVGVSGAVGYGIYEWRSEFAGAARKIAARLGKK